MNDRKKTVFKKAGASLGTIAGIVIVGILLVTGSIPTPRPVNDETGWHIIWEGSLAQATEASLGATAGGFLEIFFVNRSAIPNTVYAFNNTANIFETWADANLKPAGVATHAYANADTFNLELKHSTLFDIVVRVRFNKTQCWDGSKFIAADTRVNITCAGFATMADIVGTSLASRNNTGDSFLWTNTYWQDADGGTGTGFTLAKGAVWSSNTIAIKIWAKY